MSNAISEHKSAAMVSQLSVFQPKTKIRRTPEQIIADLQDKLAKQNAKQLIKGNVSDIRFAPFTKFYQECEAAKVKASASLGTGPQSIVNRIKATKIRLERYIAKQEFANLVKTQVNDIQSAIKSAIEDNVGSDDATILEAYEALPKFSGLNELEATILDCDARLAQLEAEESLPKLDENGNAKKRGRPKGSKNK